MRLRHPAHVAEVRLAVVAQARVDAGEVHRHGAARHGNIPAVQGRWSGKPVQVRRGPATVTGDAHRTDATGPPCGPGRRERVEPGSQETSLRPSPLRGPRGKGVGSMKRLRPGIARRTRRHRGARRAGARRTGERDRARRGRRRDARAAHRGDATDGARDPRERRPAPELHGHERHGGAIQQATGGELAGDVAGRARLPADDDQGRDRTTRSPPTRRATGRSGSTTRAPDVGLCDRRELQEGDEVLILVDCSRPPSSARRPSRCGSAACPPTRRAGPAVTVTRRRVRRRGPRRLRDADDHAPGGGRDRRAAAAATATTGADGTAALDVPRGRGRRRSPRPRPAAIRTAGGDVRDDRQRRQLRHADPARHPRGTDGPADTTAPIATIAGLRNGKVYRRQRAPRELCAAR